MRRLLLVAAILLAGPVRAQVDPKIAEFCIKAQDFAGCTQTMTRGLPSKTNQDEGFRSWTREDGTIVRMRTESVVAMKSNQGEYGRYIKWIYGRSGEVLSNQIGTQKEIQGDCTEYTADWSNDFSGWIDVKAPERYRRDPNNYAPLREAKSVLDEFCPQMPRLATEAKARESFSK